LVKIPGLEKPYFDWGIQKGLIPLKGVGKGVLYLTNFYLRKELGLKEGFTKITYYWIWGALKGG